MSDLLTLAASAAAAVRDLDDALADVEARARPVRGKTVSG